ncbi:MAG: phosphoglycerate kinase [Candidatus Lloydbacteria bacterium CG22_combo_CG10-13_8_21_14_all_47_15]|uniref:Phosphoglycerate kinase n=1 Tax=Candidatus Lloydbacteria bacterium CG22_combo_CG10-13_8_21_14_all_47_15 TaxID=1974635 RepID=A0A2H0CU05_9BACT|nr:MAG: phosphoglycerate kinase [Candidatus Lloydbacteria bacterium CG22_combo_CG10-13_8_21_14_all_47_15]
MSNYINTLSKAGKEIFKGKRVLLRLDLNVTISETGGVADDFRIQQALPTIEFLRDAGAKTIILSHIGRHKGDSLEPVFEYMGRDMPLSFAPDLGEATVVQAITALSDGSAVLVENLRRNEGEEKNTLAFAERFAQFADIYVNDAFATSHRAHASIVSLPKLLPSYAGFLFEREIAHLSAAFDPPKPFLFILGGAKFETKLPLIKRYLARADMCFIGGALAHNFFKAKGYPLGSSLVDRRADDISEILAAKNLFLPVDVRVKNKRGTEIKKPAAIQMDDQILDAGPETLRMLDEKIQEAHFVLWNGPIGDYKISGFGEGTETLVRSLVRRKFKDGELVLGGGDTAAVISRMRMTGAFPFISTGGGAMLEYLAKGTLPGIEALKSSAL